MIDLSKISLGSGDAEGEPDLAKNFIETDDYRHIVKTNKQIILGGRGSGKSALFKMLSRNLRNESTTVVALTPDDNSWNTLTEYAKQSKNLENLTKEWEFLILTQVLDGAWSSNFVRKTKTARQFREEIIKNTDEHLYRSSNEREKFPLIVHAVHKILQVIPFSLELSAMGLKLTARSPSEAKATNISSYRNRLVARCYDLLTDIIPTGKRIYVLVDDLDRYWDGSEDQITSLTSLFLAADNLRAAEDSRREKLSDKVILVIFIRNDMYEKIDVQSEPKYFAIKHELHWDTELLMRLVEKRLESSTDQKNNAKKTGLPLLQQIFESGKISGKEIPAFLAENIVPRPRDHIFFISRAVEQAVIRGRNLISVSDAASAIEKYSDWRRTVIRNEWKYEHEYVPELIDSFTNKGALYTYVGLNHHLDQFKRDHEISVGNKRTTKPKLLNDLLNWGVMGRRKKVKKDGKTQYETVYRWEVDQQQAAGTEDEFAVHPSLWPILAITTQTRKKAALAAKGEEESRTPDIGITRRQPKAVGKNTGKRTATGPRRALNRPPL